MNIVWKLEGAHVCTGDTRKTIDGIIENRKDIIHDEKELMGALHGLYLMGGVPHQIDLACAIHDLAEVMRKSDADSYCNEEWNLIPVPFEAARKGMIVQFMRPGTNDTHTVVRSKELVVGPKELQVGGPRAIEVTVDDSASNTYYIPNSSATPPEVRWSTRNVQLSYTKDQCKELVKGLFAQIDNIDFENESKAEIRELLNHDTFGLLLSSEKAIKPFREVGLVLRNHVESDYGFMLAQTSRKYKENKVAECRLEKMIEACPADGTVTVDADAFQLAKDEAIATCGTERNFEDSWHAVAKECSCANPFEVCEQDSCNVWGGDGSSCAVSSSTSCPSCGTLEWCGSTDFDDPSMTITVMRWDILLTKFPDHDIDGPNITFRQTPDNLPLFGYSDENDPQLPCPMAKEEGIQKLCQHMTSTGVAGLLGGETDAEKQLAQEELTYFQQVCCNEVLTGDAMQQGVCQYDTRDADGPPEGDMPADGEPEVQWKRCGGAKWPATRPDGSEYLIFPLPEDTETDMTYVGLTDDDLQRLNDENLTEQQLYEEIDNVFSNLCPAARELYGLGDREAAILFCKELNTQLINPEVSESELRWSQDFVFDICGLYGEG